jgi:hypothetical protein
VMINLVLSSLLFLAPLIPADLPPTMIYMGQGLEPVATIKVRMGHVVGETSILMTPYEFIRVKSAIEGAGDLCNWAVEESTKACIAQMDQEIQRALQREDNDKELLRAYEHRLKVIEEDLQASYRQNKIMLYLSASLGAIALSATTYAILK